MLLTLKTFQQLNTFYDLRLNYPILFRDMLYNCKIQVRNIEYFQDLQLTLKVQCLLSATNMAEGCTDAGILKVHRM